MKGTFYLSSFGCSKQLMTEVKLEDGRVISCGMATHRVLHKEIKFSETFNFLSNLIFQYYMMHLKCNENYKTPDVFAKKSSTSGTFKKSKITFWFFDTKNKKQEFLTVAEESSTVMPEPFAERIEIRGGCGSDDLESNYSLNFRQHPERALGQEWIPPVEALFFEKISMLFFLYCLKKRNCLFFL